MELVEKVLGPDKQVLEVGLRFKARFKRVKGHKIEKHNVSEAPCQMIEYKFCTKISLF